MHRRKLQLIGGTSYSVTLPKAWVGKHKLKEQSEVLLLERNDGSLTCTAQQLQERKLSEIRLDADEYRSTIDQVLFAAYYLGIETITVYSKKELSSDARGRVKLTLSHMSGTEISYEDRQKITIKVLLDKTKIDALQILYRISLIIDLSITDLLEGRWKEVDINEQEIDRLYHLMAKIVSLALLDSNILLSSGIGNVSLIPSFFLISKKLENIADNIHYLSTHKKKPDKAILLLLKDEITRSIRQILNEKSEFEKIGKQQIRKLEDAVMKIRDTVIQDYLRDMVRYTIDVEEEIVNILFYRHLIAQKLL